MSLEEQKARETLSGTVERVTYQNEETGYCVLKVKARGKRHPITLVGHLTTISPGEHLDAEGEWTNHREFGLQFKAEEIRTSHPTTAEGMERYLGSGMVKGIGPHFAQKLIETFGTDIFEVIEHAPEKLRRVPGIGPLRLEKIQRSWQEQKVIREIMMFLQSHGVGTNRAVRIFKTYGNEAIEKVRGNPYQLARDISGIGFKSADQIAANLGVPRDSLTRARAGVQHVLEERMGEGHCAYPFDQLLEEAGALLEMDREMVEKAVREELADTYLFQETIAGRDCVFPAPAYMAERGVAALLMALAREPVPWGLVDGERALSWVNTQLDVTLNPLQEEAVKLALQSKCVVITGGPGTGKTTLTRAIAMLMQAKRMRLGLCSPTGRAAKRLSECTGLEAKTIHRLLGYDRFKGGFLHDRQNPLELDVLVLDEASMVDIFLMYHLLKALPPSAALIIVGDVDQIPSVGPGNVLADLIASKVLPTVRLTHIFRQAAESHIISGAHRINAGEVPAFEKGNTDFFFFPCEDASRAIPLLVDLVRERVPRKFGFHPVRDIQVLCPMNRGGLGAHAINVELQRATHPAPETKIERFGFTYTVGDKVMVTANDYDKEVFNGDIGFVKEISVSDQTTIVNFEGRDIEFDFGEMDILTLAYATTIHKSQGSEYPAVILPLFMNHYLMLKRNLLYTAVTRGKKLVIVVGQKRALATAVERRDQGKRWTRLAERLASPPAVAELEEQGQLFGSA